MPLNYFGPYGSSNGNFERVALTDFDGANYGYIYLCNKPAINPPDQISIPGDASAVTCPGPYPDAIEFPTVFASLANRIGQQLGIMNGALLNMNRSWLTAVMTTGTGSYSSADLNTYIAGVKSILVMLGFVRTNENAGKSYEYWPLVPINDGSIALENSFGSIVSTNQVQNPKFKKGLQFNDVPILNEKFKATGTVVFNQDCEWEASPPNNMAWNSFGFIISFGLTLTGVKIVSGTLQGDKSSVSSSSSAAYAASSSMPGK